MLRRSSGPSLTAGCVVRSARSVLRPPPTPFRHATHFPRSSVIGCDAPATISAGHWAGEGLPSSRRHYRHVPRPIRRGVPRGCFQALHRFHGLHPDSEGLGTPLPHPHGRVSNDAAGFASRYGPHRRSPIRAFDAGLRPRPFPDGTASLLPGLLAATRTGLTPASDDELTNKISRSRGITSRSAGRTKKVHCKVAFSYTTRLDAARRRIGFTLPSYVLVLDGNVGPHAGFESACGLA